MICFPMWVYHTESKQEKLVKSQQEFDAHMKDGYGLFEDVIAVKEIKDDSGAAGGQGQGGPAQPDAKPKKGKAKA